MVPDEHGALGSPTLDLAMYFDRVVVMNLDRRADRWQRFQAHFAELDWPFRAPQRVSAIDGRTTSPPEWWRAGNGAWGCFRSKLMVFEAAIADGVQRLLLLEDDVCFVPDLRERATAFLAAVPPDWDQLYLGGEHLHRHRRPPEPVGPEVVRPFDVNRNHAVAFHGRFLPPLVEHITDYRSHMLFPARHVDHRIGMLHRSRRFNVYAPVRWMAGQTEGYSDVREASLPERFWDAPAEPRAVTARRPR